VSDEIHGERGYQIVLEHADTPELQQKCLKICEVGAQMRLSYTTALYYDYVAQDIPLSDLDMAEKQVPPASAHCCKHECAAADAGIRQPHRRRMDTQRQDV